MKPFWTLPLIVAAAAAATPAVARDTFILRDRDGRRIGSIEQRYDSSPPAVSDQYRLRSLEERRRDAILRERYGTR